MKTVVLLSAALALLAVAGTAQAAAKTIDLDAYDSYFTKKGTTTPQNPEVLADPGDSVTFTVSNKGQLLHNLNVADLTGSALKQDTNVNGGENKTLTVNIPMDAKGKSYTYRCDYHAGSMQGTLKISGTADAGGDKGTPGFEAVLALGAIAVVGLVLRRRGGRAS